VAYEYDWPNGHLRVVFKVEEAASFHPCSFENFVWFSDAELREALNQEVPLFQGRVTDLEGNVAHIRAALERILLARGIVARVQGLPYGSLATGRFQFDGLQFRIDSPAIFWPSWSFPERAISRRF